MNEQGSSRIYYKLSISTKLKIDGSAVSASMNSALEAFEPNSSSWRGVSAIDIEGGIGSGMGMTFGSGREWDKDMLAASSGKSCCMAFPNIPRQTEATE